MATHPDYPSASSFEDRHGRTRWRFRRNGKTVALPGQPGDAEFVAAYDAAANGRVLKKAQIVRLSSSVEPGSFRDAWRKVKKTSEWLALDEATHLKNTTLAEEFLEMPLAPGLKEKWGDQLVRDFRRRHIKAVIASQIETPHKAKHMLVAIRKMIYVALDEEWIEADPTYKLSYRPEYKGWRAWTEAERAQFEERWPVGSAARTCYGLALWLGNRRSDVSRLKWSMFDFERRRVTISTKKGDKDLVLPITPMLLEILAPLDRSKEFVLLNAYGNPFSEKSLTGMMAHWTKLAGMVKGCTLHGLRKTLGKLLAESGSTTRQLMEMLGHDDIEHAELYSREAEQQKLARDAMAKLSRKLSIKKAPERRN
ncbi:tyrosine-type recombinase/integrase [Rhizobium lentis]|uniref:tyrosine-type recombinase/integrase n=1 Tax=Rhizobium lentis TaxID=1138194 RepID=UPI001C83D3C7|nr:site-specific integrase [Rhizobium lentis]MBX5082125.1 tyrosine-type recombinase/integrase [Rhizobium lentis]MBX5094835.1 tyrosine-type recombinase/integrase [Rhizobium lentis]MBX5119560.1 tyrosine-type recombinase/integrase [Rhizobium lentis]